MSRAIVVGKTEFRDLYADGNIRFVVRKDMGNGTFQCISEDEDYTGVVRYYDAQQIRAKLEYARNLERVFAEREDYWANRTVGEVLHYHNGFGQYIRGVVIEINGEKKLRPTAMVGNWHNSDLPKRRPNGEIYYPYNADKIINANDEDAAWQPAESCVYENPLFSGAGTRFEHINPQTAEPIDLSVPDMTPEEKAEAAKERRIDAIREVLENRYRNSDSADSVLGMIKTLV